MAQYSITYKADGLVLHELRFMGEEFSYWTYPLDSVSQGNVVAYDTRLKKAFPNLGNTAVKLLKTMVCSDKEALEAIKALTKYEQKHDWSDD